MKTITYAKALEIIDSVAAVMVDGGEVTFPAMDDGGKELSFYTDTTANGHELFEPESNELVEVDNYGQMIFLNQHGQKTAILPLVAQPVRV